MENKVNHILVAIQTESKPGKDASYDLLYLSGHIEVLVDETLLVVGRFPGALLLLPSIDELADAMRKVRDAHTTIEVTLTGDTSSLWLFERKRGQFVGLSLAYYATETNPVTRAELDQAFQDAIAAFFEMLIASRPIATWSHEVLRILDNVILTWPTVERLKSGPVYMRFSLTFSLRIDGAFVRESDLFEMVKTLGRKLDRRNIEGAIIASYNGVEVVGEAEWDVIDQLLAYIVNEIESVLNGVPFDTYFPDQPLRMRILTKGENVTFSVGTKVMVVKRLDFLKELYGLCERFFDLMMMVFPSGWYQKERDLLAKLPLKYPLLKP